MEQAKEKQSVLGTVLVISLSVVLMVVSALLLFVPQIRLIYICYFICGFMIAAGIYMIVRYFMTDAFRNMNEYGFSEGMLMIILGICGMLRAQQLAGSFLTILGIALSFSGIVKLQYAMDLKRMKDVLWVPVLIIAIAVLAASVFVILQLFAGKEWSERATWYTMLGDGGISLLTLLYMMVRVKLFKKKEQKEKEAKEAAMSEGEAGDRTENQQEPEAPEGIEPTADGGLQQKSEEDSDTGKDVLQETLDEMETEIQQEENSSDIQ